MSRSITLLDRALAVVAVDRAAVVGTEGGMSDCHEPLIGQLLFFGHVGLARLGVAGQTRERVVGRVRHGLAPRVPRVRILAEVGTHLVAMLVIALLVTSYLSTCRSSQ